MSVASVNVPPQFPVGTSVSAYRDTGAAPSGPPAVPALETKTVGANSVLTFTTLQEATTYWAGAPISGVWLYFEFTVPSTTLVGQAELDAVVAREPLNVFDPRWAGGMVPDGVTDNSNAWDAIVASVDAAMGAQSGSGSGTGRLGELEFPKGRFYFSRSTHLNRVTLLQGAGGFGWYPATELIYADGVPGIVCDYYLHSSDGGRGDWSVVRDLALRGLGTSSTSAHAVTLLSRLKLENFGIWNFGGDGLHIQAGVPDSNANLAYANHGTIYYCKNGFYSQGNDANAGLFMGIDCSYNREWNWYETSFLGNTFVMCHSSSPGIGAYFADGATNTSVFLGCYAEGGDPTPSRLGGLSMLWLGGVPPVWDSSTIGTVVSNASWLKHSLTLQNSKSPKTVTAKIGELGSADNRLLTIEAASRLLALIYEGRATGWWALGSDAAQAPLELSDQSAAEGAGQIRFGNGYILGAGAGARRQDIAGAAPATGPHAVGDVVWNNGPAAGGKVGWVCTAAGTPGTWKPFGAIDP